MSRIWKALYSRKFLGWIVFIIFMVVAWVLFLNDYADDRAAERAALNAERGITISEQERVYKYSPSGIKYYIDCIEGQEFIVGRTGRHGAWLAGPLNGKEC